MTRGSLKLSGIALILVATSACNKPDMNNNKGAEDVTANSAPAEAPPASTTAPDYSGNNHGADLNAATNTTPDNAAQ